MTKTAHTSTKPSSNSDITPLKTVIIVMILLVSLIGWLMGFWVFGEPISLMTFINESLQSDSQLAWQWSRVLGVVAYLLFWLSVMTGLMIGSKNANTWFARGTALDWHQFFSSSAIITAVLHAMILYFDGYLSPSMGELLIPFGISGLDTTKRIFAGIGQLALYLSIIITLGHHAKTLIRPELWRYIHATALLAYAGIVAHGLFVGSDSTSLWLGWLYFFSNAILGTVLCYRVIQLNTSSRPTDA